MKNFVDWCGHVLNTLVEGLEEPENSMRDDLDEIRFFHRLFGEDAQFVKSPERDAMRDALKELEKVDLVESRGGGNHWKATRKGRRFSTDIKLLQQEIGADEINEEEEQLLRFVNLASQQVTVGADYVWLAQVSTEQLMIEFESEDREATYYKFHRVASELEGLGLVEMKPLPGHHLNLKANLMGILWETGRDPLGELEMGHVLFIDIVGYSKLPMDQQALTLKHLQESVRGTNEFRRARSEGKLISLPTGDGMALVFFRGLTDHVECARSLSQALKQRPELKLRMGVHSGPVYRVLDINANRNVSGGGINLAQRVMDCGDAGHILLSKAVADVLLQLGNWNDFLHDLGEAEVKHGVKVHVFNLYDEKVGNPEPPAKFSDSLKGTSAPEDQLEDDDKVSSAQAATKHYDFSEEELILLKACAEKGELFIHDSDQTGKYIEAGKHAFYDESDASVAAVYIDAFDSLCGRGLVRYEGGQLYMLNGKGFRIARALKGQENVVAEQSEKPLPAIPLDRRALAAYVGSSQRVKQLDKRMAEANDVPLEKWDNSLDRYMDRLLEQAQRLGIITIADLDEVIKTLGEKALLLSHYLKVKDKMLAGYCIERVFDIKAAQSGSMQDFVDYYESLKLTTGGRAWAEELWHCYEQIKAYED